MRHFLRSRIAGGQCAAGCSGACSDEKSRSDLLFKNDVPRGQNVVFYILTLPNSGGVPPFSVRVTSLSRTVVRRPTQKSGSQTGP
jgi:hypothetical protein